MYYAKRVAATGSAVCESMVRTRFIPIIFAIRLVQQLSSRIVSGHVVQTHLSEATRKGILGSDACALAEAAERARHESEALTSCPHGSSTAQRYVHIRRGGPQGLHAKHSPSANRVQASR